MVESVTENVPIVPSIYKRRRLYVDSVDANLRKVKKLNGMTKVLSVR